MSQNENNLENNFLPPEAGTPEETTIKAKEELLLSGEKTISFFSLINDELYCCLRNRERATIINAAHGLQYENPSDLVKQYYGT